MKKTAKKWMMVPAGLLLAGMLAVNGFAAHHAAGWCTADHDHAFHTNCTLNHDHACGDCAVGWCTLDHDHAAHAGCTLNHDHALDGQYLVSYTQPTIRHSGRHHGCHH